MKKFKVYLDVTTRISVGVGADDADMAVHRVRQRLDKDLTDDQKIDAFDAKETEDLAGRVLTAEELAYCNGRGYGLGYDTDAFDGLQWKHIVDDAVAICRTCELWFSSPQITKLRIFSKEVHEDDARITCPFCLHLLALEMRYEHLHLRHWNRHNGKYAAARVDYTSDTEGNAVHVLRVNGIEVVKISQGYDHDGLRRLAEKINGGPPLLAVNEGIHKDLAIEIKMDGSSNVEKEMDLLMASMRESEAKAVAQEREDSVERLTKFAAGVGAQEGHALELWVIDRCIEEIRKVPACSLAGPPPAVKVIPVLDPGDLCLCKHRRDQHYDSDSGSARRGCAVESREFLQPPGRVPSGDCHCHEFRLLAPRR